MTTTSSRSTSIPCIRRWCAGDRLAQLGDARSRPCSRAPPRRAAAWPPRAPARRRRGRLAGDEVDQVAVAALAPLRPPRAGPSRGTKWRGGSPGCRCRTSRRRGRMAAPLTACRERSTASRAGAATPSREVLDEQDAAGGHGGGAGGVARGPLGGRPLGRPTPTPPQSPSSADTLVMPYSVTKPVRAPCARWCWPTGGCSTSTRRCDVLAGAVAPTTMRQVLGHQSGLALPGAARHRRRPSTTGT